MAVAGAGLGIIGGIAAGVGGFLQDPDEQISFLPDPTGSEGRADHSAYLNTQLGGMQLSDLSAYENFLQQEALAQMGLTATSVGDFETHERTRRAWEDAVGERDRIDLELRQLTQGRAGGSRTAEQELAAQNLDKDFKKQKRGDAGYQALQKKINKALKAVRAAEPEPDSGMFGSIFGKVGLGKVGDMIDGGIDLGAKVMFPGFGGKMMDAADSILGYDESEAKSPEHKAAIKKLKRFILEQKAYKEAMPGWQERQDELAKLPPGGAPGSDAPLSTTDKRRVVDLQNQRDKLRTSMPALEMEMRRGAEDAFKLTGIHRELNEDTKAGRVNAIESELEKRILAATRGEGAADPTVEREIEKNRRVLHEQLRRDNGSDFASTTAGSMALRDFERSSTEARAAAHRQVIMDFVPAAGAYAQNTGQAQKNLFGVLNPALTLFEAGREHARDFTALAEKKQNERIAYAGASQMITPHDPTAAFLQSTGSALGGAGAALSGGGYTR